MVLADVQYWDLVVQLDFEFDFESVEMERGGTGRRFDGRAVHDKGNCDAQQASYASGGQTSESC